MPPAKKADATAPVVLRRLEDTGVDITIRGMTPVIPHKWSEKAKSLMPGAPGSEGTSPKKGERDPEAEAEACTYYLEDGRPGIPATAFKAAMVSACRFFDKPSMAEAKLMFHVDGEGPDQLVPIEGKRTLREDTPRNANGGADLRYRYAYSDWSARLRIRFAEAAITPASVITLLDAAGRVGVGDWRPGAPRSSTGTFGTWRIVEEEGD